MATGEIQNKSANKTVWLDLGTKTSDVSLDTK